MERRLHSHPYTLWQLIKVYWQSEQRFSAYAFLFGVIVLTGAIVGVDLVFNYWNNHFYNALQDYNKRSTIDLMLIFLFIASVFIILQVYRYYLQSMLGLRWRNWLTHQFLNRWLDQRSYYYLEAFDNTTDNPDQRIQEDINALVTYSLDLTIGLISSVTTLIVFLSVLWSLSGPLIIPLGSFGRLIIPSYLVWVAVIYAGLGTFFTFRIGRPLVSLNFEQQRREADFRFAAVDLRQHAEHVALYRGEHHQKNVLDRLFGKVLDNWYMIILRQKLLLWLTAGYNQLAVFVPFIAVLPNYFGKVFKLGGMIQALRAFAHVQDALSYIVTSYTKIAEWQAVSRRLITFLNHMNDAEKIAADSNKFIFTEKLDTNIVVKNVTASLPTGTVLLKHVNQEFAHGKNYVIKGHSGIGKSTLVRVIAGIWPYGSGEIDLPKRRKIMYVPQKSYMPLGTLREALLFPDNINAISDEKLKSLLRDCGLAELAPRIHEVAVWSLQLSPGEQQRIAFVRVIIHEPDWVFLDESTSALDLANEKNMYQLLKQNLPNCSVVSVGHRPSLDEYHEHEVDLSEYSTESIEKTGFML